MPFEFTGKAPSLGSTSDAFKPFSLTQGSCASPISTSSFATTSSFNAASSFGFTSSSANTSFTKTDTSSLTSTNGIEASTGKTQSKDSPRIDSTEYDLGSEDDALSRTFRRVVQQRLAVFGDTDVAADEIVLGYLGQTRSDDGLPYPFRIDKLAGELKDLARTHPEAMHFLNYAFDRATKSASTKMNTQAQNVSNISEDECEDAITVPDVHHDIEIPTQLYKAIKATICNDTSKPRHYRGLRDELGQDLAVMIAQAATKSDVKEFLLAGGHPYATPTPVTLQVDKFADWIFEKVYQVKKEFKAGWKVKGRDDLSYFGSGTASKSDIVEPGDFEYPPPEVFEAEGRKRDRSRHVDTKVDSYVCSSGDYHTSTPFRFLDIPPELRSSIYRLALAPGTVSLRSCVRHLPLGTSPVLTPGILATSRQMNREAAGLIWENTFTVNLLLDSNGTARDALHRTQVPSHVLPRIRNLVLVIDATRYSQQNCKWDQLQALTSLTTLRIAAIEGSRTLSTNEWTPVLEEMITRIPAACTIEYGCSSHEQLLHVRHMADIITEADLGLGHGRSVGEAKETDARRLRDAAERMTEDVVQGSKSGQTAPPRLPLGHWKGLGMLP